MTVEFIHLWYILYLSVVTCFHLSFTLLLILSTGHHLLPRVKGQHLSHSLTLQQTFNHLIFYYEFNSEELLATVLLFRKDRPLQEYPCARGKSMTRCLATPNTSLLMSSMSIPLWWGTAAEQLQGIPINELQGTQNFRAGMGPRMQPQTQSFTLRDTLPAPTPNLKRPAAAATPRSTVGLTFHRFYDLPLDIRHIIWTYTLPGSRIVDIIYDKNQNRYFSFNSRPPVLLHIVSAANLSF